MSISHSAHSTGCCDALSPSVVSDSCEPMDCSLPDPSAHGDSPGMNTGMGCHAILQGIFPTQGSNPSLLHYRQSLYQLSYQGTPIFATPMDYTVLGILQPVLLEWVACPFSSGSSQPRNQTGVSCIASGFFTSWATREARSEDWVASKRL